MSDACPFCEQNADRIAFEASRVLGIWDTFPASPGHLLIVTRRHVGTWFEANDQERAELAAETLTARACIEREHAPDGYNIGVNVRGAGGQTVPHLHLHVIPRYAGDVPDPRGGVRGVIPSRQKYG